MDPTPHRAILERRGVECLNGSFNVIISSGGALRPHGQGRASLRFVTGLYRPLGLAFARFASLCDGSLIMWCVSTRPPFTTMAVCPGA